ncbi:MAG TPA: HD domain-containing phosphohydrolase, partial [Egibacteraceae bacterium]|nr:HD domain-containing phosphohydrolase [Egibacteraceae bacterium]
AAEGDPGAVVDPGEELIGAPEPEPAPESAVRLDATLFMAGVPDSSRQQVARDDCVVIEDIERVGEADAVLVSTRLPRVQLQSLVTELRPRTKKPIIALAHAGGEQSAVEVMRSGGSAVVAEGNEHAVRALLAGEETPASLTETYDAHMGRRRSRDLGGRGRDPFTNLPTLSAFEGRLREFEQSEEPVRIGFLRILNFDHAARRLATEATGILRRRLAMQYAELARENGVELFAVGPSDFAFLAPGMTGPEAQFFGRDLARVTEAFAPTAHGPLGLAVGHAGPELSSEIGSLRELAQRAVALAAVQEDSVVIGAEELSRTLTSTTELEVALRMLQAIERQDPAGEGHGARVALRAAELAHKLGFEGHERAQIRFAAHLHDLGKIGLPVSAMHLPEELDDEQAKLYRTHPSRGAEYLLVSAGKEVAAAVAAHHEHWDGTGFPYKLAGQDIPVAARIICVADAWDRWAGGQEGDVAATELMERLREGAGTRFDPAVVDAAVEILSSVAVQQADEARAAGVTS